MAPKGIVCGPVLAHTVPAEPGSTGTGAFIGGKHPVDLARALVPKMPCDGAARNSFAAGARLVVGAGVAHQ